jgi:glycosyltransferase involved in cell wall biosynthesis
MSLPSRSNVAALIPCYREEKHIRDVATRTGSQLDLVLVVDDGSPDRTAKEAAATGVEVIRHAQNQGKGAAIKTGLRALTSRPGIEWILILDGDGQHLPEEIPNFLGAGSYGAQLIVGNRMQDTRKMPLVRKLTNLSMSKVISSVVGQPIPDSQCGFRMFSRELALAFLDMPSTNFDFESEMLVIAARQGQEIASANVSTIYGDEVSKIHPVRDTIRFFQLLLRIRRGRKQAAAAAAQAPA